MSTITQCRCSGGRNSPHIIYSAHADHTACTQSHEQRTGLNNLAVVLSLTRQHRRPSGRPGRPHPVAAKDPHPQRTDPLQRTTDPLRQTVLRLPERGRTQAPAPARTAPAAAPPPRGMGEPRSSLRVRWLRRPAFGLFTGHGWQSVPFRVSSEDIVLQSIENVLHCCTWRDTSQTVAGFLHAG